jgi:hypothetical protein
LRKRGRGGSRGFGRRGGFVWIWNAATRGPEGFFREGVESPLDCGGPFWEANIIKESSNNGSSCPPHHTLSGARRSSSQRLSFILNLLLLNGRVSRTYFTAIRAANENEKEMEYLNSEKQNHISRGGKTEVIRRRGQEMKIIRRRGKEQSGGAR